MRPIDADALELGKFIETRTDWHKGWNDALDAATTQAPTIDAVEVVRCKGCKHWRPDDDIGHCENPDGLDNYALPNDFCSYGERKNDGK